MQGTWFDPWSRKFPLAAEQLSLVGHNYWAHPLEPTSDNYWASACLRACAPQQEKPPQWEAHTPQLEKVHEQQQRPRAAKKK